MSKQLKNMDKEEQEAFEEFNRLYSYNAEDLARVMTEDELKEICLRVKCRVDMDLWNPVYDMQLRGRKHGKLKNLSKKQEIDYLAKCVNKYKPSCLYDEEIIRKVCIEDWRQRKKFNILRVELWKYDREQAALASQTETPKDDLGSMKISVADNTQYNQLENNKLEVMDIKSKKKDVYSHFLFISDMNETNWESIEVEEEFTEINSPENQNVDKIYSKILSAYKRQVKEKEKI